MLNTSADELYKFNLVAVGCDGVSRETCQMATGPPHEIIGRVDVNPSVLEQLFVPVASGDLPTANYDQPLVRTSAQPPFPLATYMDGLPYILVDSVLGVWLINLASGTRHTVAIIGKNVHAHAVAWDGARTTMCLCLWICR